MCVSFCLPESPEYSPAPSEPATPVHARIASAVPLMVREARRRARTLTPRRRVQLDVTDLMQEGWLALLNLDHQFKPSKYDPARGGYLAFVRIQLRRHFARVVARHAYTLSLPRPDEERRERTQRIPGYADSISLATRDAAQLSPRSAIVDGDPVAEDVERRETAFVARSAVKRAVDSLQDNRHAAILRRTYGILDGAVTRQGCVGSAKTRKCAESALRDVLLAEPVPC